MRHATYDPWSALIVCSGAGGIGPGFWERYKGPSEKLSKDSLDIVTQQGQEKAQRTRTCVDCGVEFVPRSLTVRCPACRGEHERDVENAGKRRRWAKGAGR